MHPHAGGPPVVVDRLCQRLAGRGWDVRVIATDSMADGKESWQQRYREHYPLEIHAVWPSKPLTACHLDTSSLWGLTNRPPSVAKSSPKVSFVNTRNYGNASWWCSWADCTRRRVWTC